MKRIIITSVLICLSNLFVFGQDHKGLLEKSIPAVELKNLKGQNINTGNFANDGKPIIISFWATWCGPCKKELNAIHDEYIDWQEETGVKLIAISIDDERTKSRVLPYVDGQGWDYEILLDPNSEFRRAMGVNNVPHTFVVDGNGKIVFSHNNYSPGDEEDLYDFLIELVQEK